MALLRVKTVLHKMPLLILRPHVLLAADRDGDGHIEAKEIQKVMKNVGVSMTDSEAKKLIDAVDEDGNGMVSRSPAC